MSSSVLIDFFHLLATVAWIGGMIYNAAIFPGLMGAVEPPQRGRVMGGNGETIYDNVPALSTDTSGNGNSEDSLEHAL